MPAVRPGSVTAAGVMAIIYGALFSLCGLIGVAGIASGGAGQNMFAGAGGDPNQDKLQKELEKRLDRDAPGYQAFHIGTTILGLLEALGLLIGGIGLMSMHRWARTLTLVVAVVAMLVCLLQAVYTTVYIIPAINDAFQVVMPAMLQQQGAKGQQAAQFVQTMVVVMAVAMVVIYVLILVYLLIIVLLLRRRHVLAAFAGERPAWSDGETERLDDRDRDQGDDGWGGSAPPRNPEDDYRYR